LDDGAPFAVNIRINSLLRVVTGALDILHYARIAGAHPRRQRMINDEHRPLACDMTAIPADERGRHGEVTRLLFAAVQEARDEPDALAFRLPPSPAMLLLAAEFVARESRCCPFLGFAVQLAPDGGPLWLRLTGRPEVKAIARAELASMLPEGALSDVPIAR
jgi:hypothetical protein